MVEVQNWWRTFKTVNVPCIGFALCYSSQNTGLYICAMIYQVDIRLLNVDKGVWESDVR